MALGDPPQACFHALPYYPPILSPASFTLNEAHLGIGKANEGRIARGGGGEVREPLSCRCFLWILLDATGSAVRKSQVMRYDAAAAKP